MDRLRQHLLARNVRFEELPNGDVFFRRSDGQGMYVRAYNDGTFDWCVNAARNDTNLMDFRSRERHDPKEALQRIDDFLGLIVWGEVVIDTLGLVRDSIAKGMSPKEAEKVAEAARNFSRAMHDSGMDASEIRNRFAEIHEQLRRERASRVTSDVQEANQGDLR